MHLEDTEHSHDVDEYGLTEADRQAMARAIAEQDTLELLTVGIDIGSSTSHLLFARVFLKRQVHELSTRFVVVDRTVVWRSPILLTPFVSDDETIDADALATFFSQCYEDAGISRDEVDSGAVILTGEAIKQKNARAIDEIFASDAGRFVCATAGHRLECILAAHGSGAAALAEEKDACVLHVDIGGGTTKLALIDRGTIRSVAAFACGGRLLASDDAGAWTRINGPARQVADELGIELTPETVADPTTRERVAARMATLIVDQITGGPVDELGRALELTDPLDRSIAPDYVTFSGGVSEYIFGHEPGDHGDIAGLLAASLAAQLEERVVVPVLEPGQGIRATVIGASQFTVQVSGKTIYTSDLGALPVQNVPVVHLGASVPEEVDADEVAALFRQAAVRQDQDIMTPVALAFTWTGLPTYERLEAMARGIHAAADAPDGALLALIIEGDVGQTLGRILDRELGLTRPLVSIDGMELKELDFVDIGALMDPPGVVPVVIKSLLFH